MKSPEEIKVVHDFLVSVLAGNHHCAFSKKDRQMLQGQYDVLCWLRGCDNNDSFQSSMESLKDFLGRAHTFFHGRKFRSRALVE